MNNNEIDTSSIHHYDNAHVHLIRQIGTRAKNTNFVRAKFSRLSFCFVVCFVVSRGVCLYSAKLLKKRKLKVLFM